MMPVLLDLTLRGSAAFLVVLTMDACFATRMRANWRRWWWLCIPVAFLSLYRLSLPAPLPPLASSISEMTSVISVSETPYVAASAGGGFPWFTLWAAGALVSLAWLLIQTFLASRQWRGERFCMDARLLGLLEDCRLRAGISAPIGLILTDRLDAPAILGWLRPRILLPRRLAETAGDIRLAHIFCHELAHFRSLDVPCSWAFSLARCVHWFNPFAYFAERGWARFREEAADERAIAWASANDQSAYGETLLSVIRQSDRSRPFGALAIGETFPNLKRRILMIKHYPRKSSRFFTALAGLVLLAGISCTKAPDLSEKRIEERFQKMEDQLSRIESSLQKQSAASQDEIKIYVSGDVKKPGVYVVHKETSLLAAITMAGGYDEYADPKRIKISRTGKEDRLVSDPKTFKDVLLVDGDVVVVPRAFW